MVQAKAKPEGEGGSRAPEDARARALPPPPSPGQVRPGQRLERFAAAAAWQPHLPARPPRSHCNVTRRRSDDPRSLAWGPFPPCHFGWLRAAASSRWASRLVGRASLMRFAAMAVLARCVKNRQPPSRVWPSPFCSTPGGEHWPRRLCSTFLALPAPGSRASNRSKQPPLAKQARVIALQILYSLAESHARLAGNHPH